MQAIFDKTLLVFFFFQADLQPSKNWAGSAQLKPNALSAKHG